MRMAKLMLVCICLAGLTQLVWSQNGTISKPGERAERGIPGFLDPRTGMFTARVQSQEPTADVTPDTAALTDYTGTWTFTIDITVSSAIPASAVIACDAQLSVDDISISAGPSNGTYFEHQGVLATGSGGSRTCVIPLHYSWYLYNAGATGTDTVVYSYNVTAVEAIPVGSTTEVVELRRTQWSPSATGPKVPAPGASTATKFGAEI